MNLVSLTGSNIRCYGPLLQIQTINGNGIQNVGSSYCTWEEASTFAELWKKNTS